ncbi:hypothetical protein ACLKA6_003473 [Drosophila palustris]
MLHLRLFDNSLYYTLASVSSGMLPPPQASNGSQLTFSDTAAPAPVESAVNLTYFTPAISHVMLAPTPTTDSSAQTVTAVTMTTTTAAAATTATTTTTSPGSDFQAAATAANNLTSPHAGELDNLNSFYFYESAGLSIGQSISGRKS